MVSRFKENNLIKKKHNHAKGLLKSVNEAVYVQVFNNHTILLFKSEQLYPTESLGPIS